MGVRHQAREAAMSFLYQNELQVESRTQSAQSFINHFRLPEPFWDFFNQLVSGVQEHQKQIDGEIETTADNWKLSRMAKIDLSILRVAVFELLFCPATDHQVIIDEAIELGKDFGNQDSASFINGILDPVAKRHRK